MLCGGGGGVLGIRVGLEVLFSMIINVQATERFGAGSVYLIRLGSGLPGRLGVSWWGVSAIVDSLLFKVLWEAVCETRA